MQAKWYEEIINDLKYDDYILIIETYNTIGVRAKDYRLESGGYISSPREINYVDGLYCKYEKDFFDAASKNDNAVHVYVYEKGKFKEYRQFAKKDYDMFVLILSISLDTIFSKNCIFCWNLRQYSRSEAEWILAQVQLRKQNAHAAMPSAA